MVVASAVVVATLAALASIVDFFESHFRPVSKVLVYFLVSHHLASVG